MLSLTVCKTFVYSMLQQNLRKRIIEKIRFNRMACSTLGLTPYAKLWIYNCWH